MTALSPPIAPPNARRQSSGGRRLSGFSGRAEDIENCFDENDDEAERHEAALEAEKRRQLEKVRSPLKETPGHKRRMQEYTEWMQMANENKVTEKNSWAIRLIDQMDAVIGQDSLAADTDFQKAATTIEAAVKIHTLRIDSVATMASKLSATIGRTGSKTGGGADGPGDDNEDAEGDGDAVNGGETPANKRTRKPTKKEEAAAAAAAAGMAHIEENVAALNVKKIDRSFAVDPLFHRTSAKFDEGGAAGMLLNNLAVGTGTALVFDTSDAPSGVSAVTEDAAPPEPPIPASLLAGLIPSDQAKLEVAAAFEQFWDSVRPDGPQLAASGDPEPDSETDELEEAPAAPPDTPSTTQGDAVEHNDDNDFNTDDYGTGFDADDDDDDGRIALKEAMITAQAESNDPEGEGSAAAVSSLEEILETGGQATGQLAPEVVQERGLLSQHAPRLLGVGQRWAGPGHWRFPSAASTAAAGSSGGGGGGGGRPKKAAFLIDFTKAAQIAAEVEAATLDARGATLLTKAQRDKARVTETTLPHDCHYTAVDMLQRLFNKPEHLIAYKAKRVPVPPMGDTGDDTGPEPPREDQGDGFGGDSDYGGDDFGGGDDYGGDSDMEHDDNSAAPPSTNSAADESRPGFELVDAPVAVEKLNIDYARRAKTVDIGKLRGHILAIINDEKASAAADKKGGKGGALIAFQSIIDRLHERMPPAKLAEVSIAHCFYCMLHLANTEGLEISGGGDNLASGEDLASLHVRMPAQK